MSRDSGINKCSIAARISGGLTRLAAKATYYTGLDRSPGWPRRPARSAVWTRQGLAAAGVVGAMGALGYALIRARKKRGPKYGGGVTMLGYYPHAAKLAGRWGRPARWRWCSQASQTLPAGENLSRRVYLAEAAGVEDDRKDYPS